MTAIEFDVVGVAGPEGPVDAVHTAPDAPEVDTGSAPRLGSVLGLAVFVAGFCIGVRPLTDSSFLTHLATGRLILAGGVPRTDPYTFTSGGDPWTVQSWLASTWYATVEQVAGMRGLQLFTALLAGLTAWLVWTLTARVESVVGRLALVLPVLAVASGYWAERPFLIALALLCLVLLAADGRLDPRWCVPVMWVWVNVHGSFPFAVVVLGVLWVGHRLDHQSTAAVERTSLWCAAGMALGAVNPLGPKLLWFPVQLLGNSGTSQHIAEWKAPSFVETWQKIFLIQIAVVILLLARRRSWTVGLAAAVLVPLALISLRNIAISSIVLAAVAAPLASGLERWSTQYRRSTFRLLGVGLVGIGAVLWMAALANPALSTGGYPTSALRFWTDRHGLDASTRLITPDVVGNYLEAAYVGDVKTFLDDRAELFQADFMDDALALYESRPGAVDQLDEFVATYGAEGIVWYRERPLSTALALAPQWRIVYSDARWIVAEPR